jgi:hypothetical protein
MTPPRSSPRHLGRIVLGCVSLIAVAGACSSAATPVATEPNIAPGPTLVATVSTAPTAAVTVEATPEPSQTASARASVVPPPPRPPATAVLIPTPTPLPNITGDPPTLTPAPACGVNFKISVDVENDGEARMLSEVRAFIVISRHEAAGERFLYKDMFTIPALVPDGHIHLGETKRLSVSGRYTVTAYLDSNMWLRESDETDNNPSTDFDIPFGPGCSKP